VPSEFDRLQEGLPQRYTLLREIDRGGMARVYIAREQLPPRDVAIKVLDEQVSARLGRERFVREVEVTSRLSHPYIIPIYTAGEASGTLYYVMPFITGESLRDRLKKEGQLPIDDALRITLQVADALEHAHHHDVVHRDIKPANILFQSGHAVVTDFGIARALRAAEGGDLTQSGLAVGTPDYMSPEQTAGDQQVDHRADLYSLACVLYEMLGGQAPFHSRTPQATLARHMADRMPSLQAVRATVSPELEDVIRTALSKSPSDRYQTAADFVKALREVDARATATSLTPERVHRRTGEAAFRRSLKIAGTLIVVAALGVAYQTWSPSAPAPASAAASGEGTYQDSVAFMPLYNRTGDPDLDYVGASLADEIIGHLAQVPRVKVITTHSVESLRDRDLDMQELMDILSIGHLFQGSYELRGSDLIITVVESDQSGMLGKTWSFSGDRAALDSLQRAAAHEVAESFLEEIGLSLTFADDEGVYGLGRDAYLAGNAFMVQRTPREMFTAIEHFREAIALDSRYAPAYAGLSTAYALTLFYMYDVGLDSDELAARALALADRAVDIDPDDVSAHTARGLIRGFVGQEVEEAERAFARAQEIAPNVANAPSWSARILEARGRFDEAFREAERARDLDPFQSGRRVSLAGLAFLRGDHDLAVDEAREALRLQPGLTAARAMEARALALAGRTDECLSLDLGPWLVRALCLHAAGRTDEAQAMVDEAEQAYEDGTRPDALYVDELVVKDLAAYYGFVGDVPEATRWVREAFRLSPFGVDSRVLASDLFDPVRADPDFASAVEEVREQAGARVLVARAAFEATDEV
jgi:tetratricopeptide (TPR) repeat protein